MRICNGHFFASCNLMDYANICYLQRYSKLLLSVKFRAAEISYYLISRMRENKLVTILI